MSEWINTIPESEFPSEGRKVLSVEGVSIILFKFENDYYAIRNQCSHENYPLEEGELEGDSIICPLHGAKFCIKTGEVKSPPAFEDINTYSVQVKDNIIQIKIDND